MNNFSASRVNVFVLSGDATVNNQSLNSRDGFGVWNVNDLDIKADSNPELLLMEVPMSI